MTRCRYFAAIFFALTAWTSAQTPPVTRPARAFDPDSLPRPPIPADPLELVTGAAQPVQTAEQRIAITEMLNKARTQSNVRAQPYDMKTTVTATGSLPSDGTWTLRDTAPGHGIYRWTANGPSYAAVNLYPDTVAGGLYSNQPNGLIPLRLAQIRGAMFLTYPGIGSQSTLRTFTASLDGAQQTCVLSGLGFGGKTFTGGRNWEETEYCINAGTGLLTTYSSTPGLYLHYDYTNAIPFNGKTIPGGFRITEAGKTVIEGKIESVVKPPDSTDPLFSSTGLTAVGVGTPMSLAAFHSRRAISLLPRPVFTPGSPPPTWPPANAVIQIVVLHGTVAPDGHLSDVEILATTDPSLNQAAVDRATVPDQRPLLNNPQPGTTPIVREGIFTYEFVTAAQ